MRDSTTKIVEEIEYFIFKNLIQNTTIKISTHALNHLSDRQRKIFKEEELIWLLEKEKPRKVYLQKNGRYSVYYKKDDGFRNLIIEIKNKEITIVTFIDTLELPKVRFENEK